MTNVGDVARTRDQKMRSPANAGGDAFSVATNEYVGQGKQKTEHHVKGKGFWTSRRRPDTTWTYIEHRRSAAGAQAP